MHRNGNNIFSTGPAPHVSHTCTAGRYPLEHLERVAVRAPVFVDRHAGANLPAKMQRKRDDTGR